MKKRILIILPVAPQPRYIKRMQKYLDKGFKVTVASYERDYIEANKLPEDIEYHSLGKVQTQKYFQRIPRLLYLLKKLLSLSKKNDIVYIHTLDILIFLYNFIPSEKLYFELGDIRNASENKFISGTYDLMLSKALKKCGKIFVTSPSFKSFIIEKYKIKPDKIEVIENKLSSKHFPINKRLPFKRLEGSSYTLGIIGFFRYRTMIDFLKVFHKRENNFTIKLFGDGPLKEEMMSYVDEDKVQYFGQFKNPGDLAHIYKQIDLSFTMYNAQDKNVRLALPNKLYESIYFNRPILVSSNTYLEEMVDKFKVGFSWHQNEMVELIEYLNSVEFINKYNSLEPNFDIIKENKFLA